MKVEYAPEDWKVVDTGICKPNPYADGYGDKIPTSYIIYEGRKIRPVYAICWSNCASFYCMVNGKRKFIQDWRFP